MWTIEHHPPTIHHESSIIIIQWQTNHEIVNITNDHLTSKPFSPLITHANGSEWKHIINFPLKFMNQKSSSDHSCNNHYLSNWFSIACLNVVSPLICCWTTTRHEPWNQQENWQSLIKSILCHNQSEALPQGRTSQCLWETVVLTS